MYKEDVLIEIEKEYDKLHELELTLEFNVYWNEIGKRNIQAEYDLCMTRIRSLQEKLRDPELKSRKRSLPFKRIFK